MQYPASELEYWSLFFYMDENRKEETEPLNVKQSVAAFKEIWG